MDDLISRQAAIKEIARWMGYIDEDMILRIQTGLKKLPSVQPEIIRCKDCNWWLKQPDGLQGSCMLFGMHSTGAWYCGNARKREENENE